MWRDYEFDVVRVAAVAVGVGFGRVCRVYGLPCHGLGSQREGLCWGECAGAAQACVSACQG